MFGHNIEEPIHLFDMLFESEHPQILFLPQTDNERLVSAIHYQFHRFSDH